MTILNYSEIIEENGKTIRENNFTVNHKIPLGSLVKVKIDIYDRSFDIPQQELHLSGECTLWVVSQMRDCDGSVLYGVSNIPVIPPENPFTHEWLKYAAFTKIWESGYSEESLSPTGIVKDLHRSIASYLQI